MTMTTNVVNVKLLDGSVISVQSDFKSDTGADLLSSVSSILSLVEKDYFGFLHVDKRDQVLIWLRSDKLLKSQLISGKDGQPTVEFAVKFYAPEPGSLRDDVTRYQMCLQIQKDIREGKLPCSFVTQALLGAYLVQSEIGDWDPLEHGSSFDYLSDFAFAPPSSSSSGDDNSLELLLKISEIHRSTLRGQSPAEAELHYLENAKKLAMYGVNLHAVTDSEDVELLLGVCSSGILVYRDRLRINRFPWPKIIKISYKRNGFFVKLRPGEFESYEYSIGFKVSSVRAAKRLWKIAAEHHTFFRLQGPEPVDKFKFPRFGSKFRYSGKTMRQTESETRLESENKANKAHLSQTPTSMNRNNNNNNSMTTNPLTKPNNTNTMTTSDMDTTNPMTTTTTKKPPPPTTTTNSTTTTTTTKSTIPHKLIHNNSDLMMEALSMSYGDEVALRKLEDELPSNLRGPLSYGSLLPKNSNLSSSNQSKSLINPKLLRDEDYGARVSETSFDNDSFAPEESFSYRSLKTASNSSRGGTTVRVAAAAASLSASTFVPGRNSEKPSSASLRSLGSRLTVGEHSIQEGNKESREFGDVVSSQTITSHSKTVETTTYSLQKSDGDSERRIEQKVTIQSDGEPIDHDEALALAIQEATQMNPEMIVEKIEIHQSADLSETL